MKVDDFVWIRDTGYGMALAVTADILYPVSLSL
jgi:hypothetical protein